MANKISIRDIEQAIKEAMVGSEIQFSDSVYEEKDGVLRLIIFFNKLFSTNNVVLYTKLLFEVDKNKEYLEENKKGQNFFKYLYDINCQYKMKLIDDINDFKNQWSEIIKNNKFGPNMKILSEFIKQPSFVVNDWFDKNNIKDVSLTGFKYEPKMKIMPCKSLSFHFVLNVNNSDDVELYIRKDGGHDYTYTFNVNGENQTIEKSDLTTLVQTIAEVLKDSFSGKSKNESAKFEDDWIPCPKNYELKNGEEVKIKPECHKYMGDFIFTIGYYIHYAQTYSVYCSDKGFIYLDKNEMLVRNNQEYDREIRWYKKGKLLKEELENDEEYIGKKVKMRDDSEYNYQAYGKEGDGYGVVISLNKSLTDHILRIRWNNGRSDVYRLTDVVFIDDEEPKIRWYKKGKLLNEELENNEEYVGKKVKMRDDSEYKFQAYEKGGDGYGVVTSLYSTSSSDIHHVLNIRWNNGRTNVYRLTDVDLIDNEEQSDEPKIRWYKKGKLSKEGLEYHDKDYYIGKTVKMRDDSAYRYQAYDKEGDGYGKIVDYHAGDYVMPMNEFIFRVLWNNNIANVYRSVDLEIIDEKQPIEPKIRWYKKGEFLKEELEYHDKDYYIGKTVKIRDDSMYQLQAYENGGDGYGKIVEYYGEKIMGEYVFRVVWNNEHSNGYRHIDLEIIDEKQPIEPKIRWYKKGKLLKEELENDEKYIGKTVKMRDDSRFKLQAYEKGGDGYGKIIEYYGVSPFNEFAFRVLWNNNRANGYRLIDLEIIDDEQPIEPKIRWYKKGKLN